MQGRGRGVGQERVHGRATLPERNGRFLAQGRGSSGGGGSDGSSSEGQGRGATAGGSGVQAGPAAAAGAVTSSTEGAEVFAYAPDWVFGTWGD